MKKFIVLFVVMFGLFSFCYATEWGIGDNNGCFAVRANWSKTLSSQLTLDPNYENDPTYAAGLNTASFGIGISPINYAIYSDEHVRINTGICFTPVISYLRATSSHTNMTAIHQYTLSILAPEIDFKVIGGLHLIATTSLNFYWEYAQATKKCDYFHMYGSVPELFDGLGIVYYFENSNQKSE